MLIVPEQDGQNIFVSLPYFKAENNLGICFSSAFFIHSCLSDGISSLCSLMYARVDLVILGLNTFILFFTVHFLFGSLRLWIRCTPLFIAFKSCYRDFRSRIILIVQYLTSVCAAYYVTAIICYAFIMNKQILLPEDDPQGQIVGVFS